MNRAAVKVTPGADLVTMIQTFTELGRQLVLLSTTRTLDFMNEAQNLIASANLPTLPLPALHLRSLTRPCCEIPEKECPPKCACNIHWSTAPGGQVTANITVTNAGSKARNFTFQGTQLSGPGNPQESIQVTPASSFLERNQSIDLKATLNVGNDFQLGGKYTGEIHIEGASTQSVCITLNVGCPEQCGSCSVHQGDPPVRIRAHHWYDHFQCEEPCFHTPDEHGTMRSHESSR